MEPFDLFWVEIDTRDPKALQGKESPKAALDNAVKACNTLLQQQDPPCNH